ncbi:MAG: tetratricopeptide repeat protein [Planctomycetales bacterium]|nr:tetratricopeptide repeat protein [Planctomycetales bacterium]
MGRREREKRQAAEGAPETPAPVPDAPPSPPPAAAGPPPEGPGSSAATGPEWLTAAAIAIAGILLYLGAFGHDYVLDDIPVVRESPILGDSERPRGPLDPPHAEPDWLAPARLWRAVSEPWWLDKDGMPVGASNWRPLATLSLLLDRAIFGSKLERLREGTGAEGMHRVNAVLHGLAVLALFPLARRFAGPGWRAAAAMALFAAHPAHTEAVCGLVGRTDLLATVGFLAGLEAFLRYRETEGTGWLVLSVNAFALGLGGKESALALLPLLPVADVLLRNTPPGKLTGRPLLGYLPFAAVAAVYLLARVLVLGETAFEHKQEEPRDLFTWLAFIGRNSVVSLLLLVAPVRFHHVLTSVPSDAPFTYPDPEGIGLVAWPVLGAALWGGWIALWLRARAPVAAFLWLAALLPWVPTSGLLRAAAGVSLRFLLIPTAFAACAAVRVVGTAGRRSPALQLPLSGALLFILLGYAGLALSRVPAWRNNGTFYRALLEESPRCYTAHFGLGAFIAQEEKGPGNMERARERFREAIAIAGAHPRSAAARMNLGISYEYPPEGERFGPGADIAKAIETYRELIAIDPARWDARLNMAADLMRLGRREEAREHFREVVKLNPNYPGLETVHLGIAESYEFGPSGVRWGPDAPLAEAVPHYLEAIRRNPSYWQAHGGLGWLYLRMGRRAEAAGCFREALRIAPDFPGAMAMRLELARLQGG